MNNCKLCQGCKIATFKTNISTACPACDFENFNIWLNKKSINNVAVKCLDCNEYTTQGRPRCFNCHCAWKETYILCNECGNRQHQAKFVMCFQCNTIKNLKKSYQHSI